MRGGKRHQASAGDNAHSAVESAFVYFHVDLLSDGLLDSKGIVPVSRIRDMNEGVGSQGVGA